jgi:hypothetical protein
MSSDAVDNPAKWRFLAAETRATAERMMDPEAKRLMCSIAKGYDRLAQRAEARIDPNRSRN